MLSPPPPAASAERLRRLQAEMPAPFHFVFQADCCYVGGGEKLHSTTGASAANQSSCEALCNAHQRCNFISRRAGMCVLCATCKLRPQSGHFTSWSRFALPATVDEIAPHLQAAYSEELYGAPGRVDIASLRLVWLSLLPDAARAVLARAGGVCKYDSGTPWRPFFAALDIFANPLDAMWLSSDHHHHLQHRHRHRSTGVAISGKEGEDERAFAAPSSFPVANHSWIEVTHCSQGANAVGGRAHGWQFGPMWLYAAPGSGVSINVGRTAAMSFADASRLLRRVYPPQLECACEAGCAFGLRANSTPPARNGSSCIRHFEPSSTLAPPPPSRCAA